VERVPDRAVALVPREETVENLLAVAGEDGERLVHGERVVQARKGVFGDVCRLFFRDLLTRRGALRVDAEAPRELREPGFDRLIVAQIAQALVGAREHLLEHVLGVGLPEAEALDGNCVHVPGEAVDELAPGILVAGAAARDKLCVGFPGSCHVLILTRFWLDGYESVQTPLYAPAPMVVIVQRMIGEHDLLRRSLAEFVGTFAFVFVGVGAIASAGLTGDVAPSLLAIAFANGLAIAVMVSAVGHISGGHFNPAITLAFFVTRRLAASLTIAYLAVQLGAAVVAVGLIKWLFPGPSAESVGYGSPALDPGIDTAEALVIEAILTFFLVWVVFATTADIRGTFKAIAGLAIGLTITFDTLAGGPLTGAMMNPARAFGPQLIDSSWDDFWIWYAGPILGGAIAGLVYELVYLRPLEPAPVGVEGTGVDEPGPGDTALR
jgi:aquaporin TIP